MFGFLIFLFGVLIVTGMCALAAWHDYKGYKIPNSASIFIILAFIIAYSITFFTGQNSIVFYSLSSHLLGALIIFAFTMAMYAGKLLGAGDSKLASAIGLWLGLAGLPAFLFYMALMGGILAGVTLYLRKYKPIKNPLTGSSIEQAQLGSNKIPYGIAIAFGAIVSLIFIGFFDVSKWEAMITTN